MFKKLKFILKKSVQWIFPKPSDLTLEQFEKLERKPTIKGDAQCLKQMSRM